MEDTLRDCVKCRTAKESLVLILVFMEDALIGLKEKLTSVIELS